MPECLEPALHAALRTTQPAAPQKRGTHRIPLGLQLLSRKQVTESQLREALAGQRATGRGRIGDWLLEMGFASEQQITAALARQWSSPVLQTRTSPLNPALVPQIPKLLLNRFQMVPVSFVAATASLHIAFADRVDHSVLYAIERMLDCRTEHCVIPPTLLRESLLALGEGRSSADFVFDTPTGAKPGPYTFTADIPAELLTKDSVTVDFSLDKSIPAGAMDQRELGVIATWVGIESK